MSTWLQVADRTTLRAAPMERDPGYLVQVSGMATATKKPVRSTPLPRHPPRRPALPAPWYCVNLTGQSPGLNPCHRYTNADLWIGLQIAVGEEVAAFSEQLRPLVLLMKA